MLALLTAVSLMVDAPPSQALDYFQGSWDCQGHFVPSGKLIRSSMDFTKDGVTAAVLKRHADKPPGTYLASETWAFANGAKVYRASIADAFSGLRWYSSPGWQGDVWTWTRSSVGGESRDAFVYKRLTQDSMQVDWLMSRGGGPLAVGDTLTCRKV